jgi:hypothetical protein
MAAFQPSRTCRRKEKPEAAARSGPIETRGSASLTALGPPADAAAPTG